MATILSLVERLPPSCNPQPEIIAALKELLAEAEAGRVQSIAVAFATPEGDVGTISPASSDQYRIIGAVSVLLHELNGRAMQSPVIDTIGGPDPAS